MPGIMLSYRREDASAYAGRLYDRLAAEFGRDTVFMDIDTIRPGDDFVDIIEQTLAIADVVLVIIGPRWADAEDSAGRRRLEQPNDFVRLEVATALEGQTRVIPVLVGGAVMPIEDQLPGELVPLVRRNAVEVSDTRFHSDADRLIEVLGAALPSHGEPDDAPRPAVPPALNSSAPEEHTEDPLARVGHITWIESNLLWSLGVLTLGTYYYFAARVFTRAAMAAIADDTATSRLPGWRWCASLGIVHGLAAIGALILFFVIVREGWALRAPSLAVGLHASVLFILFGSSIWLLMWLHRWTRAARGLLKRDDHRWHAHSTQMLVSYIVMVALNLYLLVGLDQLHIEWQDKLNVDGAAWRVMLNGLLMLLLVATLFNAAHALFKAEMWALLGEDMVDMSFHGIKARRKTHLFGITWFWPFMYANVLLSLLTLYLIHEAGVRVAMEWHR